MKRVLILGCCGAGKTTLALRLQEITGLEVIHLDQHYHLPNWEEPPKDVWEQKVAELINKDEWIMDGNYSGTLEKRLDRADTIIYLHYSTLTCLYRIIKRTFKHYGKSRPHMAEGCVERFDLEFLHYVAVFNLIKGKDMIKKLKKLPSDKEVFILENDKEVDRWIKNINGPNSHIPQKT